MSSLVGARVVRGPDWIWGDQDGGEGYAGTIIPTPASDLKLSGPRTVTVLWDSGMKFSYQAGPEGHYNLRMIDNAAVGVKHRKISCGNVSCSVQEIQGFRFQCVSCNVDLCTSCFLLKKPHNINHNKFKRYDDGCFTTPVIVSSWSEEGAGSRIELKGIFPGAKVSLAPEWPYGREIEKKNGVVVLVPGGELLGRFVVEWLPSEERTSHRRINISEKEFVFRVNQPGIGGYYYSFAFPIVNVPVPPIVNLVPASKHHPTLTVGDRVMTNPAIEKKEIVAKLERMDVSDECLHDMKKLIGVVGTIQAMRKNFNGTDRIYVKFLGVKQCLPMDPTILKKVNQFSINQMIRIRNDEKTARQMEKEISRLDIRQRLIGAIGRVTNINEDDADQLYVHFNDNGELSRLFYGAAPLSSAWMELYHQPVQQFSPEEELTECAVKVAALFFKFIESGDLQNAKTLHEHHKIDHDALNGDGMTALQVASNKGHTEVVQWLIGVVKVSVNAAGINGFRAIHYAVQRCRLEVLKFFIQKRADLDSQTDEKQTALHIAVSNRFTECSRLLIEAYCEPNLQDAKKNTPLHLAILHGNSICVQQLLSKCWISFELHNEMGFTVLHLAVIKDDIRAIELIMEKDIVQGTLLERMPQKQCTVLHYACVQMNFQMAKILVNKSKLWDNSSSPLSPLAKLLEAKDESGRTAFLIASQNMDYPVIELLIEAGTDVNSVDKDKNTSILLAATGPENDATPSKDLSPFIFEVFQGIKNDPDMAKMKNLPLLSLICYYMVKGCSIEATNNAGVGPADALVGLGYLKTIAQTLNRFVTQFKNRGSVVDTVLCMGRINGCVQPAECHLFCPLHKISFKACYTCFPHTYKGYNCGCKYEKTTALTAAAAPPNEPGQLEDAVPIIENEAAANVIIPDRAAVKGEQDQDQHLHDFKWFSGASKSGYLEDQRGNTFTYHGTKTVGGRSVSYRCNTYYNQKQCTAIARKNDVNEANGRMAIKLEKPHTH